MAGSRRQKTRTQIYDPAQSQTLAMSVGFKKLIGASRAANAVMRGESMFKAPRARKN
jgi:hypothetical protein